MDANPLRGWTVDRSRVAQVGHDLRRPECVLAEPNGDLWVADARGGVVHIRPDGSQRLIAQQVDGRFDEAADLQSRFVAGTLPNGLAFAPSGELLIANFGTDRIERMNRDDGRTVVLLDRVDGRPLGKANFVLPDSRGRLWVSVSTQRNPWTDALRPDIADGCIVVVDDAGARIVAEGLGFTNEMRLDASEQWLYVVETMAGHVTRFRVGDDGSLGARSLYGPASLGPGAPDGIAFDAHGNLWVTMIMADRILAITPEQEVLELLDDGDALALQQVARHAASGTLTMDVMAQARGTLAPWMASITFGGPDLKTVYVGSLFGSSLATFRSPVAGAPMLHWR